MDKLWIPKGPRHDLNFEHDRAPDAGPFTGGGWKLCWHITVSPWTSVDSMVSVLKAKNAAPHLVIGGRAGYRFPVVVQMIPFNRAGRALAHPSGPETNRANVIQVEICARPGNTLQALKAETSTLFDLPGLDLDDETMRLAARADKGPDDPQLLEELELCLHDDRLARTYNSGVAGWTHDTYKALANMHNWVDNRVPIPKRLARRFTNTDRFSGRGFVTTKGHLGHMHVPGNTHYDPTTAFRGDLLLRYLDSAPNEL